ncbi:MAG: hypothetical protein AMXMBFR72_25040 [Betaproteobacteria bacterium]
MNSPTDAEVPRGGAFRPRVSALITATFAVVVTFTILATALVVGRLYANDRVESLRSFLERKAEQFALALGQSLADRAKLVALEATRPAIVEAQRDARRAQIVLSTMQAAWPEFAWIGVTDARGRVLAATGGLRVGEDASRQPWFAAALHGPHVGDLHEAPWLASPLAGGSAAPRLLDIAHPVRGAGGALVGVFAAHVHERWIEEVRALIAQTRADDQRYELALFDRTGRPLLRSASAGGPLVEALLARIHEFESGSAIDEQSEGARRLIGFSGVAALGPGRRSDWIAVATVPMADVDAEVRNIYVRALGAGLVTALLVMPFVLFVAWRLARPIQALTERVRASRLAQRIEPERVPIAGTRETAALGGEIRALFEQLERQREALRAGRARLAGIVESSPDAIVSVDLEGRIVLFNPAAEAMFWIAHERALGQPLGTLIPERLREAHTKHLLEFARGPGQARAMGRAGAIVGLRAGGEEFPVEASIFKTEAAGETLLTAILRDVTERRAAEQALRASEARYRDLFETHPLPMWVYDHETLRFLEVNAAAQAKYGWTRDEFRAMTILDIRPSGERAAVAASAQAARGERLSHSGPWRHRLRSGREIDVEISGHALTWNGRPARLIVAYDVTDRLRAERELRASRQQLSELSRQLMDKEAQERGALGQILHDRFAQNLAAAKLGLEAAAQRVAGAAALEAAREGALAGLRPAIDLLSESIRDVRGLLNELRPPMLGDFGLRAALAFEIDRRRPLSTARIELADVAADDPEPRLEPTVEYGLFIIAREALHNAMKHARAGRIAIEVSVQEDRAELAVRDDGAGFDPADETLARGHLGLVGMRERAQWIGAQLAIESTPGAGTRVHVLWRRAGVEDGAGGGA